MSSADSSRYQSRIFNFVHQQAQQFSQKCDRAWRQVQYATNGLATVLLYPLYLLLQSTRSPGKQFEATGKPSQARLAADDTNYQSPSVDTPIQRVLQLVDRLPSEAASTNPATTESLNKVFAALRFKLFPSSLTNPSADRTQETETRSSITIAPQASHLCNQRPIIQGIATQLASRILVLVTVQNEILDVLTPQQQAKITEQIIGEVANYWQYQRLAHTTPKLTARQKLLAANHLKATAARNQLRANSLPPSTTPLNINPASTWRFLDSTIAELETTHLAPVSTAAITFSQRSRGIIRRLQTQLGISLSQTATAVTPDGVKTQSLGIPALIWAAVDYFFGDRGRKFLHQPAPSTVRTAIPINRSPQLATANSSLDADPWLTLEDLFGNSTETANPATSQASLSNSAEKPKLTFSNNQVARYSLRRFLKSCQQFLLNLPKGSELVNQQHPAGKSIEPVKRSPGQSQLTQSKGNSVAQPSHAYSTQMQPAPDWIEINATTMGYVKHPLEQVLEWLDRAMLWLEEVILKIWQRLQQLKNSNG